MRDIHQATPAWEWPIYGGVSEASTWGWVEPPSNWWNQLTPQGFRARIATMASAELVQPQVGLDQTIPRMAALIHGPHRIRDKSWQIRARQSMDAAVEKRKLLKARLTELSERKFKEDKTVAVVLLDELCCAAFRQHEDGKPISESLLSRCRGFVEQFSEAEFLKKSRSERGPTHLTASPAPATEAAHG